MTETLAEAPFTMEGRIALGSLLARFPGLRLGLPAEQLTWRLGAVMNGLAALPVSLHSHSQPE